MKPDSLATRAWYFLDALTWIAQLNLVWLLHSLFGGVILGVAPSTVAAATLVRRRVRGDVVHPFTEFWPVFRAEFRRANLLLLPGAVALLALLFSWQFFNAGTDPLSGALAGIALVLLGLCSVLATVLVPLYCSYDLPLCAYFRLAVMVTLTNPLLALMNLAVLAGVLTLSWFLPGIIPFFTVGLLIYLTTRLSLDFLRRNENRLAASEPLT